MALRIGIPVGLNLANPCALDDECPERGLYFDYAQLVCHSLNLNCSFSWYNVSEHGDAYENGTGTGMIGAIQRGEFDTSIPVFSPTHNRLKAVTFSSAYFFNELVMITRSPSIGYADTLNWSIVFAFQWAVWAAFFASTFSVTLFITCVIGHAHVFRRPKKPDHHSKRAGSRLFFYTWSSLIVTEIRSDLLKFYSTRILASFWVLVAAVLTGAYTSVIFSQKMTRTVKPPFTDLQSFINCLDKDQCSIVTKSTSASYFQYFTGPGAGYVNEIMKRNPIRVMDVDTTLPAILEEKQRYLTTVKAKTSFLDYTSGNRDCLYYALSLPFPDVLAFPLAKNSVHLRKLNQGSSTFTQYKIHQPILTKYTKPSKCDWVPGRRMKRAWFEKGKMLSSMTATFAVLVIGLGAAIVTFMCEILCRPIRRKVYAIAVGA